MAAQTTADTVYHLHGTVLNAVTGRPIGRALVLSQDNRLATMTNAEGRFLLDVSVPAAGSAQTQSQTSGRFADGIGGSSGGSYGTPVLTARRPGYLQARRGVPVPLDSTAEAQDIVLRLEPAASIHGQVVATGAESLRGIRVQLLRHGAIDGQSRWLMASTRQVAADGSFSIVDLQPGEYTVVTSEWSPQNAFLVSDPAAVSNQYPPDFLGDTRTLDGATRLQLGYGQAAQANLHLSLARYYPVRIPLQGLPENSGASVHVSAGMGFQLYQLGWNGRDGAVEGALPDGDYVVTVTVPAAQQAGAQIPLHIAGTAVLHAPVGLTPTQNIPVNVRDERTQPTTGPQVNMGSGTSGSTGSGPGFFLFARPDEMDLAGGGMMQNTPNGPVLQNLAPGRYHVQGNVNGNGYIAAISCNGVNLLTEMLVVNESGHTAPVDVTLRDDGGTIDGTVDLGNSGSSEARVLIVPGDGSGHVLYSYVNRQGTFRVGNVPPGSYRAFAVEGQEVDTLPYRDAQAMRPYEGRGAAVTVAAGQTAQVKTQVIHLYGNGAQP